MCVWPSLTCWGRKCAWPDLHQGWRTDAAHVVAAMNAPARQIARMLASSMRAHPSGAETPARAAVARGQQLLAAAVVRVGRDGAGRVVADARLLVLLGDERLGASGCGWGCWCGRRAVESVWLGIGWGSNADLKRTQQLGSASAMLFTPHCQQPRCRAQHITRSSPHQPPPPARPHLFGERVARALAKAHDRQRLLVAQRLAAHARRGLVLARARQVLGPDEGRRRRGWAV